MRLDRYLAEYADLSRKEARRAIHNGWVEVDGQPVHDHGLEIATGVQVRLDGQPIAPRLPRYWMLHKPLGYVCSTADPHNPTVLGLLPEGERDELHSAGRLDSDTTGLVLLTDDGQWSHRVTSPRHAHFKRYRVQLAQALSAAQAQHLRTGVWLHGEDKPTLPAKLEFLQPDCILLAIQEGRYHQVKRMLAAVDNQVIGLHREAVGAVELDPQLAPGQARRLTAQEVASF